MHKQKVGAYGGHQQVQIDGREIDKIALLNCASRLKVALDDEGRDMKLYQDALRHNQQLWTMFQIALTDPDNQLPQGLKLTLLNLSGYVDKTSFRAIHEFAPQLLNSLIDIDRIIAAGLGKKPDQAEQPPAGNAAGPVATAPIAGTPAMVMTSA